MSPPPHWKLHTLNKSRILSLFVQRCGLTGPEANLAYEKWIEIMMRCLENGEKLQIKGWGKFIIQRKHARRVKIPNTDTFVIIPPITRVKFIPSPYLTEKFNV